MTHEIFVDYLLGYHLTVSKKNFLDSGGYGIYTYKDVKNKYYYTWFSAEEIS